jgi:hypothetical protein
MSFRGAVWRRNLKVKRTKVPAAVARLRKLLGRYALPRNEIIHERGFTEDDFRFLEALYIMDEMDEDKQGKPGEYAPIKKELTREAIRSKKIEFLEFNKHLATELRHLLDALAPHYAKEAKRLRAHVSAD